MGCTQRPSHNPEEVMMSQKDRLSVFHGGESVWTMTFAFAQVVANERAKMRHLRQRVKHDPSRFGGVYEVSDLTNQPFTKQGKAL